MPVVPAALSGDVLCRGDDLDILRRYLAEEERAPYGQTCKLPKGALSHGSRGHVPGPANANVRRPPHGLPLASTRPLVAARPRHGSQ